MLLLFVGDKTILTEIVFLFIMMLQIILFKFSAKPSHSAANSFFSPHKTQCIYFDYGGNDALRDHAGHLHNETSDFWFLVGENPDPCRLRTEGFFGPVQIDSEQSSVCRCVWVTSAPDEQFVFSHFCFGLQSMNMCVWMCFRKVS